MFELRPEKAVAQNPILKMTRVDVFNIDWSVFADFWAVLAPSFAIRFA